MGLFSFSKKSRPSKINWTNIESVEALEEAISNTESKHGLFFKHSTRCNISAMALNGFESQWEESDDCDLYFIDLIAHRDVSNALSELTGIEHQSPQVILVNNKEAVYTSSHNGISARAIKQII
ncbi:MAG TPA: bacillithiol system redox-active protein YtxJ [Brumimicrobium sp.]|nr:bacillithiol system redox-active protein YtxJ [Brumimicrobium sp.]